MDGQLKILADVAIAMLLGGVIGLERETADKPAGLRTHMLVAATAALLVGVSDAVAKAYNTNIHAGTASDPFRIVQAIVMGIGFLGAGTIIQRRESERIAGLTTGASLLLAASLGICVAAGQVVLAAGVTAMALVVLIFFGYAERTLAKWRQRRIKVD